MSSFDGSELIDSEDDADDEEFTEERGSAGGTRNSAAAPDPRLDSARPRAEAFKLAAARGLTAIRERQSRQTSTTATGVTLERRVAPAGNGGVRKLLNSMKRALTGGVAVRGRHSTSLSGARPVSSLEQGSASIVYDGHVGAGPLHEAAPPRTANVEASRQHDAAADRRGTVPTRRIAKRDIPVVLEEAEDGADSEDDGENDMNDDETDTGDNVHNPGLVGGSRRPRHRSGGDNESNASDKDDIPYEVSEWDVDDASNALPNKHHRNERQPSVVEGDSLGSLPSQAGDQGKLTISARHVPPGIHRDGQRNERLTRHGTASGANTMRSTRPRATVGTSAAAAATPLPPSNDASPSSAGASVPRQPDRRDRGVSRQRGSPLAPHVSVTLGSGSSGGDMPGRRSSVTSPRPPDVRSRTSSLAHTATVNSDDVSSTVPLAASARDVTDDLARHRRAIGLDHSSAALPPITQRGNNSDVQPAVAHDSSVARGERGDENYGSANDGVARVQSPRRRDDDDGIDIDDGAAATDAINVAAELRSAFAAARSRVTATTVTLAARASAMESSLASWRTEARTWVDEYEAQLETRLAEWEASRSRDVRLKVERELKKKAAAYEARLAALEQTLRALEAQAPAEMAARLGAALLAFAWGGAVVVFTTVTAIITTATAAWDNGRHNRGSDNADPEAESPVGLGSSCMRCTRDAIRRCYRETRRAYNAQSQSNLDASAADSESDDGDAASTAPLSRTREAHGRHIEFHSRPAAGAPRRSRRQGPHGAVQAVVQESLIEPPPVVVAALRAARRSGNADGNITTDVIGDDAVPRAASAASDAPRSENMRPRGEEPVHVNSDDRGVVSHPDNDVHVDEYARPRSPKRSTSAVQPAASGAATTTNAPQWDGSSVVGRMGDSDGDEELDTAAPVTRDSRPPLRRTRNSPVDLTRQAAAPPLTAQDTRRMSASGSGPVFRATAAAVSAAGAAAVADFGARSQASGSVRDRRRRSLSVERQRGPAPPPVLRPFAGIDSSAAAVRRNSEDANRLLQMQMQVQQAALLRHHHEAAAAAMAAHAAALQATVAASNVGVAGPSAQATAPNLSNNRGSTVRQAIAAQVAAPRAFQ